MGQLRLSGERDRTLKMGSLSISILLLMIKVINCMPQISSTEVTVAAGDNLVLNCALINLNNNVIIWKKNERVLFAGGIRVRHDKRINVRGNSLIIENVQPEDGHVYKCQIENRDGQLRDYAQKVVIYQAPIVKISQVESYLAVKQSTNLALTCVGSGVPVPEVIWRKGSRILSRGTGEAGVLLEYITREDAGEILCEASNGVGETAVDTLVIGVLYAPEIEMIQPHLSFQPKCGLELQCVIHSSSPPKVQWMHNDQLLQPQDGVTIWSLDNLHVLQVSKCDNSIVGTYSCSASNNLGQRSASLAISNLWIEQKISDILSQEDKNSNNVRRNVEHTEKALPLISSSSSLICSTSILLFCLSHFL